jgi:tyrosinase
VKSFVSNPTVLPSNAADGRFRRADLIVYDIDSRGESYLGRVYLDVPETTVDTSLEREAGYAGRFVLFGHGGCVGVPGHCDPSTNRDPFDIGPPGGLSPQTKTVDITDALKAFAGDRVVITIVAVRASTGTPEPADDMVFRHIRLVTYGLAQARSSVAAAQFEGLGR